MGERDYVYSYSLPGGAVYGDVRRVLLVLVRTLVKLKFFLVSVMHIDLFADHLHPLTAPLISHPLASVFTRFKPR